MGSATRVSRSFGHLFGAWLILSASLVVGLVTLGIDHAAAHQFKIANVDIAKLAGPAVVTTDDGESSLASRNLIDRFGPPVTYGATQWTVVSSRLILSADNASSKPIVVIEVVVANTSRDTAIRVRSSDVALVLPDGRREVVDRFEFIDDRRVFSLEPGQSFPVTLVFKPSVLANPDLGELTLIVGEQGRVPALLPIIGQAGRPELPLVEVFDAKPIAVVGGHQGGGSTRAEILIVADRVTVGLNAGHYRAALGQRVLAIEASVVGQIDGWVAVESASYTDPSFWRLSVDGQSIDPLRVNPMDGGLIILFAIDVEPAEVVLSGGASNSEEFRSMIVTPADTGEAAS